MRIVMFNGPPGAGKDAAGRALLKGLYGTEVVKLAGALKSATHELFGLHGLAPSGFEAVKNDPADEFFGLSPREAYILVSEKMVKPVLGEDFFGRVLVNRIRRLRNCRIAAVTDSGFVDEARPVVEAFGPENVLLVRLHRPGHTFAGDSRSHIDLPAVASFDIVNDGDEAAFGTLVVHVVSQWASGSGFSAGTGMLRVSEVEKGT